MKINGNQDRYAYLRDYSGIELLPLPHTNMIEFIGMPDKDDILLSREEQGTFTVLTNGGKIMAWSAVTAKQVFNQKKHILTTDFKL